MTTVEELLDIDAGSPDVRRAELLADNDRSLMRGLVAVREARGLSQSEVGRRMGISQPSVAALERYDANPQLSTVRRYANAVRAIVEHRVFPDEGQNQREDGVFWRPLQASSAQSIRVKPLQRGRRVGVTIHAAPAGQDQPSRAKVIPFPAA